MRDSTVDRLLDEVAARHGVPAELLHALLALEELFPDFAIQGTKTEFTRRVAAILDAGSAAEGGA